MCKRFNVKFESANMEFHVEFLMRDLFFLCIPEVILYYNIEAEGALKFTEKFGDTNNYDGTRINIVAQMSAGYYHQEI